MKEFSGTLAQTSKYEDAALSNYTNLCSRYFDLGLGLIFDRNGCIICTDCC